MGTIERRVESEPPRLPYALVCQVCGARAPRPGVELCVWCADQVGGVVAEPCA